MLRLQHPMNDQDLAKHHIFKHIKFIFCIVVVNIIIGLLFVIISYFYFKNTLSKNTIKWNSVTEEFLISVIAAPFLETLLLQVATYNIFRYAIKFTNFNETLQNYLFIFLSSMLFASMHTYNWLYVVNTFIGGLSLNYSYIYFKKEKFHPYIAVVSIHLLYNLFGFAIKRL